MLRITLIGSLCLFLTVVYPKGVFGTAANLDSLWTVWNDTNNVDTIRMMAMDKISWDGYSFSKPDSAFYYAQMLFEFAEITGNNHYMAIALNTQGVSYYSRSSFEEALLFYNKSIKLKQKTGNKKGIAASYNNIGAICEKQGDFEQALTYYNKSLIIDFEINYKSGVADSYNNIGNIHYLQKRYKQALNYYSKSLKLQKEIGDKKGIANSLNNIGSINYNQGDYRNALNYYSKSLKLQKEIGNKRGVAILLGNIGGIYNKHGDYTQALKLGKKAFSLAHEIGAKEIIQTSSELLYKIYDITGYPAKALEMYELSNQMRDSLNNKDVRKVIAQFEQKQTHEKEADRIKSLQYEASKLRQLKTYSAAGVSLLSLMLGLFILRRFLYTRNQQRTIAAQKEVVEEQTKELTDSIYYAENIQKAILPSDEDMNKIPEHFVLLKPKDIVSGDFYWMAEKEGRVYFAACDCTGHGVPGAFMSMLNSALLTEAVNEKNCTRPCDIFYEVRKGIIESMKQTGEVGSQKDGMDAALCSWNKNGTLEYALANTPLFLIRNGELTETKGDKLPVGILTGEQIPFTHHELKVEKGDTVYIFSDGFPDQFGGPKQKKFMIKRFKQLLLDIHQQPLEAQRDKLDTTIEDWMDEEEQVDDILVVGMRF